MAVALIIAGGAAIIAYIIAWVIIPEEPKEKKLEEENAVVSEDKSEERKKSIELIAWISIFVGLIWFCLRLFSFLLPRFYVRLIFPAALIIVGVLLLWERRKEN